MPALTPDAADLVRARALLRAILPARLDEVAGVFGRVVSDTILTRLGADHLYDNATAWEQAEWVASALQVPVSVRFPTSLTIDQIEAGLRNIGEDPTCAACSEVFYTGATLAEHTCENLRDRSTVIVTR